MWTRTRWLPVVGTTEDGQISGTKLQCLINTVWFRADFKRNRTSCKVGTVCEQNHCTWAEDFDVDETSKPRGRFLVTLTYRHNSLQKKRHQKAGRNHIRVQRSCCYDQNRQMSSSQCVPFTTSLSNDSFPCKTCHFICRVPHQTCC